MPISDVDGYTPGHFGRVYRHIIEPACELAGFKPTLASQVKSANVIIADILERILSADMVVCDISARNPNVLYELGIRQAFDLPVTLMKDDITRDIFDIQGIRYSPYKSQLRIDLVADDISLLKDSIVETYANKDKGIFSLVQILGREKANTKSTDLAADTLAILEAIRELREQPKQYNAPGDYTKSSTYIPESEIRNPIYPSDKNQVFDIGSLRISLGDEINHPFYGLGELVGFGSYKGRGVLIGNFSGTRLGVDTYTVSFGKK